MNQQKITITVSNQQLDALEDLLWAELSDKEDEKARNKVKQLWHSLVESFDSIKEKSVSRRNPMKS